LLSFDELHRGGGEIQNNLENTSASEVFIERQAGERFAHLAPAAPRDIRHFLARN
jgi:hypothetical protein